MITKNKIEHIRSELIKLSQFKALSNLSLVADWINRSVSLFDELNVNPSIIEGFIFSYDPKNSKTPMYKQYSTLIEATASIAEQNKEANSKDFYRQLAFKLAFSNLDKLEEETRLVPSWLIDTLNESENFSSFASHLVAIESSYEDKNPNSICTTSMTLLDNILNLCSDLKDKGSPSNKINSLINSKLALDQFGISIDFAKALNCSRVLRNEKIVHSKYFSDIPFAVSISFAYLVVFMLESTLSAGELICEK